MRSSLLWLDRSDASLADKIKRAAERYRQKFGFCPDTCFVNPGDHTTDTVIENLTIQPKATIMPNHIWIGISNF